MALGLATERVAAQYPASPPSAGALRPFQLPPMQETTLSNGLKLVVVENHKLPILSLSLGTQAGSKRDVAGREGTATLLGELLTRGTPTRTADRITSDAEKSGGTISARVDPDFLTISASGLAENAAALFDLVGDVVQHSSFPAAGLDSARKQFVSALDREKSDPQSLTERAFARTLFGNHPYGRRPTTTSVTSISRDDVTRSAGAWLKPGNSVLVVAGDVTLNQARQLAQRALGAWSGSVSATPAVAAPAAVPTRIRLIHRAGAVQTSIMMGNLSLSATDPRQYALIVGNHILGGGAESRLSRSLRDQKRWTFDAHSEIERRQDLGSFLVATQVRQQVTGEALTELGDQLERFRSEAVVDSELTRSKDYLVGSFPRQVETAQQVAGQITTAKLLGLGDDYVKTFRERVSAVTALDVMAAAKAAVRPDSAVVVVLGDAQKLHDNLKNMGPVDLVDVEGKPIAVGDLTPQPGPLMVDKSQFVSRRDSFVVIVNGSPLGTFVTETVAQGDSLSYHSALDIPVARWSLDTRARLSLSSMQMRTLDQTGSMSNQPAETHLVFDGARVKGRAQIPQPGGTPKISTIDTTVVPGVVDQEVVTLVVPGLPLEPQTAYTIFVFDAASVSIKPVQVTVLAIGNLGVPAGVFPVSQVQVMAPQPLVLYITREAPRRIVKIERMGQPMSFELVK